MQNTEKKMDLNFWTQYRYQKPLLGIVVISILIKYQYLCFGLRTLQCDYIWMLPNRLHVWDINMQQDFQDLLGPNTCLGQATEFAKIGYHKEGVTTASQNPFHWTFIPNYQKAGLKDIFKHPKLNNWGLKWVLVSLATPALKYLMVDKKNTTNKTPIIGFFPKHEGLVGEGSSMYGGPQ